jgi:hypothetical protein
MNPIDNFSRKLRQAQNSKSTEFRITVSEASDLLSYLAAQQNDLMTINNRLKEIEQMLKDLDSGVIKGMDGGGF